ARLAEAEPMALACMVWGCARLGLWPGLGWMQAFTKWAKKWLYKCI
ncbi:hypothetical protein HaLaN_32097, partial [Haematococcus lacustris]